MAEARLRPLLFRHALSRPSEPSRRTPAWRGRTIYFTSESVSEGHPDKVCDRVSDTVVDAYLGRDAGGPRRLRDARHHQPHRDRRRGARPRLHHHRPYRRHDPGGDPGHRLRAGRVSLEDGGCRRPPARPVGRHRPRGRRRRQQGRGRRRPGHHVRLRHGRDAGADAGPDLLRPQDSRGPDASPASPSTTAPACSGPTPRARSRSATRAARPVEATQIVLSTQHLDESLEFGRRAGHRRALHPRHPPGGLDHRRDRLARQPHGQVRDRRARTAIAALRAARSSSTPTAARPRTAAAPSPARTRPRSTARRPTPRATWPRTSSPRALPGAA